MSDCFICKYNGRYSQDRSECCAVNPSYYEHRFYKQDLPCPDWQQVNLVIVPSTTTWERSDTCLPNNFKSETIFKALPRFTTVFGSLGLLTFGISKIAVSDSILPTVVSVVTLTSLITTTVSFSYVALNISLKRYSLSVIIPATGISLLVSLVVLLIGLGCLIAVGIYKIVAGDSIFPLLILVVTTISLIATIVTIGRAVLRIFLGRDFHTAIRPIPSVLLLAALLSLVAGL